MLFVAIQLAHKYTYIHTSRHNYVHTYIHTYIRIKKLKFKKEIARYRLNIRRKNIPVGIKDLQVYLYFSLNS